MKTIRIRVLRQALRGFEDRSTCHANLRAPWSPETCTPHPRHLSTSRPRSDDKLSFRGQLYESTAQRLARERADEARFAAARSTQGNTPLRLFATTFGSSLQLSARALTLNLDSYSRCVRGFLSFWYSSAKRVAYHVHHSALLCSATEARHQTVSSASCVG